MGCIGCHRLLYFGHLGHALAGELLFGSEQLFVGLS
uniref:Uncharacterized protein n=1 Tax=Rhizophora mucronata TaxID=61149 RepID=A0A2P2PFH4_RHIMU